MRNADRVIWMRWTRLMKRAVIPLVLLWKKRHGTSWTYHDWNLGDVATMKMQGYCLSCWPFLGGKAILKMAIESEENIHA